MMGTLCQLGGWGLAGSLVCLCGGGGGGACCVASAHPVLAFCHRAVAVASIGWHKCTATLYDVSPVPNSTHLCQPPFTLATNPPFSTPCGYGTHSGGPAGAPPLLPLTPFWLPHPGPLRCYLLLLFLYYPLCCLPLPPSVVCPLRFVAAFFLFGGFGGLGSASSASLLDLLLVLEFKEV